MEKLTVETFKEKVFDFTSHENWNYAGELPCVIDFYADWCGPCKLITPTLESLSKDYEGKVHFYKINTDEQQELSAMFAIQSIPSLLFVPKGGQPQMAMGALPKQAIQDAIKTVLNA